MSTKSRTTKTTRKTKTTLETKTDVNDPFPYLGVPTSEEQWLKYVGACIIFAGKEKVKEYYEDGTETICKEVWIMETEEETKERLRNGLLSVGVKCEEITIKWTSECTRCCECICLYNKPYQVYNSEFFIKGLSEFEDNEHGYRCPLEFHFSKNITV